VNVVIMWIGVYVHWLILLMIMNIWTRLKLCVLFACAYTLGEYIWWQLFWW